MMLKIYGIKNCDTVKKAVKWLKENQINFEFIDFKKSPPTTDTLKLWCQHLDWELLLNRRGTTWRKLNDDQKADIDQTKAIKLMIEQPNMIKRPVWQNGSRFNLGFTEETKSWLA
ncbi:MAG: arsenate reductase [Coxiellaceae bacterium]|nr:arsenate reductase [Coxiellaceae bacterium]